MKQSEPSPPTPDAIVDEVRAIRAKLSARFDNDIDKLCEYLRRKEAEYGDRVVVGRHGGVDVNKSFDQGKDKVAIVEGIVK